MLSRAIFKQCRWGKKKKSSHSQAAGETLNFLHAFHLPRPAPLPLKSCTRYEKCSNSHTFSHGFQAVPVEKDHHILTNTWRRKGQPVIQSKEDGSITQNGSQCVFLCYSYERKGEKLFAPFKSILWHIT